MTLCICYHGTSKENVESILKTGFNKRTYFAQHLEDAVGYGGDYVFEVAFVEEDLPDNWQFRTSEIISPERIVNLTKYSLEELQNNPNLKNKIFESNLKNNFCR